nr:MAG TPA: hypothetical protein [Bacteriophage sp.]
MSKFAYFYLLLYVQVILFGSSYQGLSESGVLLLLGQL